MKVFYNTRREGYSGGMCLIAANSKEEAIKIFRKEGENLGLYIRSWMSEHDFDKFYDHDEDKKYPYESTHYDDDNWKELPLVEYNGNEPCIITENGYTE